jgi:hypothetical protein
MLFLCPKRNPLKFIAVGWSWQMLDCLLIFISAAMSQTTLRLFSLSVFFVGATSLVLQQGISHLIFYIRILAVARFDWRPFYVNLVMDASLLTGWRGPDTGQSAEGFFCRCYKSGTTTVILWVQCETPELKFLKCSIKWDDLFFLLLGVNDRALFISRSKRNITHFYMFYKRSLAVARFDW